MSAGVRLHEWTLLHDTGELCPEPDDEIAGFATAWKRFSYAFSPSWSTGYRERVFEVLASDTIPLGFHGIVDACGSVRGKITVCDIKTGQPDDQHPVQLALYALGLFPRTATSVQRLNVYLAKDGSYRAVLRDDPRDFICAHELLTQAKEAV
jgi:RecB family exonuclease